MDDKLMFNNYLLILKSCVEVYVHGTLESSNDDIRKLLKGGLDDIMSSQADTFDLMTEYGWYDIKNVRSNVINQTLNKECKSN